MGKTSRLWTLGKPTPMSWSSRGYCGHQESHSQMGLEVSNEDYAVLRTDKGDDNEILVTQFFPPYIFCSRIYQDPDPRPIETTVLDLRWQLEGGRQVEVSPLYLQW